MSRDSAGINIVENARQVWGTVEGWRVGRDPIVVIGETLLPPYQFTFIASARRLADGRFALVDNRTREIRLFDQAGSHLLTLGGAGQGPGEFQRYPEITIVEGDTIRAYDSVAFRYSIFSPEGTLVREETIDPFGAISLLGGASSGRRRHFPDGSFFNLAVLPASTARNVVDTLFVQGGAAAPGEIFTVDVRLGVVHARGDGVSMLGVYPWSQSGFLVRGRAAVGVGDRYRWRVIQGADEIRALIHLAMPGQREIRTFNTSGDILRIVRQLVPLHPLLADSIRVEREAAFDSARANGIAPGRVGELFDGIVFHDSIPPYSEMHVGSDGSIWLMGFRKNPKDGPREFEVLSPEGVWLGNVAVPWSIGEIEEIGHDYLLTVHRDELQVPSVRMYHIEK